VSTPTPNDPARPGPDHPDDAAELRERADGANEEKIGDDANLREDDTAPGLDPEDGDA
jgi:hypothetical protein